MPENPNLRRLAVRVPLSVLSELAAEAAKRTAIESRVVTISEIARERISRPSEPLRTAAR